MGQVNRHSTSIRAKGAVIERFEDGVRVEAWDARFGREKGQIDLTEHSLGALATSNGNGHTEEEPFGGMESPSIARLAKALSGTTEVVPVEEATEDPAAAMVPPTLYDAESVPVGRVL
jgi:hypothetical protein